MLDEDSLIASDNDTATGPYFVVKMQCMMLLERLRDLHINNRFSPLLNGYASPALTAVSLSNLAPGADSINFLPLFTC